MRRLVYYALAFVFLVSLVVTITWKIGYIHDLRELAVVAGLSAVGVATVMHFSLPSSKDSLHLRGRLHEAPKT